MAQRRLAGPHRSISDPGTTKSGEEDIFLAARAIDAILTAQKAPPDRLKKAGRGIVPLVFHRNGKPIRHVRKAWEWACTKAGYPGGLPHDMRRSAVRNLEPRRRVSIGSDGDGRDTGRKRSIDVTRSWTPGRFRDAAAKIDRAAGTFSGTIGDSASQSPASQSA